MPFYENHVLPLLIDCACGMKAVRHERARLIPQARGRVLEVGIGTGLNLPHYDANRIESLQGLDPACAMQAKAKQRMKAAGLAVELIPLSAEKIPAADACYDTVVCTFTLCSIPDAVSALIEMRRVLAPGGRLLFCEHGRAPEPEVQRWQDRLTPIWKQCAGGCHLNRDVPGMLTAGGFSIGEMEQKYLKGPRPMTWVSSGWASV
ncbi:MAG: methyltransferase domain-containing protein [Pseudomonadota bacterium]